ncbi:hypothetical protein DYB25_006260 [Aphanomyces astaci]|uniref:Uncharacterized protein n=2 Tax=Aphanomyces astaci TaxID=112090 RepID=A0A397C601_APHAT|nr:hypothetical protein DYB25_006260 [Aphanomyces astaci]RHY58685.1 hypothetical protein DYB38_001410 [Aphanomyces astaci]RHY67888.1 hypothetical protein DYB30_002117 [Aphanomyces astaci]
MVAPAVANGLVVFDYDWSLINDDSDFFVFQQLQPAVLEEFAHLVHDGAPLTKAVDDALGRLTCTKETLVEVMARVPVQPGMVDAVRLAHEKGWDVAIVSDANTVYIQSMLAHHHLTSIISQVFTNPSSFQGDRLRVSPFHSAERPPHGCPRCPSNMCKGRTPRLAHDVVFAREGCELLRRIRADPVTARVVPWSTGLDILAGFHCHLNIESASR